MNVRAFLNALSAALRMLAAAALLMTGQSLGAETGRTGERSAAPTMSWPEAPPFVPGRSEGGAIILVGPSALEREIRAHSPELVRFWMPRQPHMALDDDWLDRTLGWYRELLFAMGTGYRPDVWDCENYAQLLVTLASIPLFKFTRADVRLPIGWITVMPEVPWAGVPAGTKHSLVMARTARGLQVIEPQTGDRVPLADYPNRHRILEAYFE